MTTPVEGRVKEVIVDSRINKVLAMRTDSVAMLEALDAISEFYVSILFFLNFYLIEFQI
mgnify:CR=1 FL=1